MVTGEWMRQKLVEPLKEKQRQEGRAQERELVHAEWREWIERKTKVEAKGEHFDEPAPDSKNRSRDQNGSKE